MHKFKRAARSSAWNDQDEYSKWTRYNPFMRYRNNRRHHEESRETLVPGTEDGDTDHFGTSAGEGSSNLNGAHVNGHSDETSKTSDTKVDNVKNRKGIKKFFRKKDDRDLEAGPGKDHAKTEKHNMTLWSQIRYSVFNSWLNVLLVFAPIGIALHFVPTVNPVVVFVINFIAIIPLAGTLSYATEEIALRVGETLGGLLNATFGNAVELIVSIIALFHDEIVIVQTSLIGSMLSNLLLVMGMCFFFGGVNRKKQKFNTVVAQTAASLLALAIGALVIPTAFNAYADAPGTADDAALRTRDAEISRGTSVMLLLVYICYLVFQLRTHEDIYNSPSGKVQKENLFKSKDTKEKGDATDSLMQAAVQVGGTNVHKNMRDGMTGTNPDDQPKEEEREEPTLSMTAAIITLLWSTVLVAICAEFLVDAINEVVKTTGISTVFVGLILLPIVGNAAEHATALTVACKDKMDLAIGVAVGSSMQIALLVLPLVVVIGWIAGKEDMTLNFDPFEIIVLFVSILLVNYLIADGESHWLEGIMLFTLYFIIAIVAWFFPNDTELSTAGAARR